MSVLATVSNVNVVVEDTSASISNTADGRSTATLAVYDATGAADYEVGQPVSLVDTTTGDAFTGVVNDATRHPYANGTSLLHVLNCIDVGAYIAGKRYYAGPEWQNRTAGAIAVDLLATTLADEGIQAAYASDTDRSVANWIQGTLTNTRATNDIPGGVLELALAGTSLTVTATSTSDWNNNAFISGLDTTGNQLQLASHSTLQFSGLNGGNYGGSFGNAYAYQKIWQHGYTIGSGDQLQYSVWVNPASPEIRAGVDFIFTDGSNLRDRGNQCVDQNGLFAHPNYDLKGFADGVWYTRTFDLSAVHGKTTSWCQLGFEGDSGGQYTAYFRDICIINGGVNVKVIYQGATPHAALVAPDQNVRISANGYGAVSVQAVPGYEAVGTWIATPKNVAVVGIYQTSSIDWSVTLPTTTGTGGSTDLASLAVSTSIDDAATWQAATKSAPIANLLAGASLTGGQHVQAQIQLAITGPDPIVTPVVPYLTWTLVPSYVATKSDTRVSYSALALATLDTAWSAGSLTNTQTSNHLLTTSGQQRSWDDANTSGQTTFGTGAPAPGVFRKAAALGTNAMTGANTRLDWAGTWQDNFTITCDVQVPNDPAVFVGVVYRTTGWQNANDTYGWVAEVGSSVLTFGYGTNTSTGGGSFTSVGTQAVTLTAGDWHTLKVTVAGNVHTLYLDDVQYLQVTNSTYTSVNGNVGLRLYNGTTGVYTCYYDNFGVMPTACLVPNTPLPNWVSPSISLGSITVGASLVQWNATQPGGSLVNVLASVNGGAYTACTNGAAIPGLSAGTILSSGTLQLKVQLQADTASAAPSVSGLTVWVLSSYSASGSRVAVPLSLAGVGTAGAATMTWAGIEPANTGIFVDSSLDGATYTQIGSGTGDTAEIAGILTQTDPLVDEFTADTNLDYISTFRTSGAVASWVWDTAHSRLTATGGTNAHLLYASAVVGADTDVSCVMDTSDNGGLVWRWLGQDDFYYVAFHDASSGNHPNTAQLFVVSGGTQTQLLSNVTIAFKRGTPHAFRMVMQGSNLLITMDGATLFETIDATNNSPGFAGLRTDSTGGGSALACYLFRLQYYGQDVTALEVVSRLRLTSTDPTATPQVNLLSVVVSGPSIQAGAFVPQTSYSVLSGQRTTTAQIYADLSKQSGNYWWRVLESQFSFQQHVAIPAPWVLTNADVLDSPEPTLEVINDAYRNSQWGTGGLDIVRPLPQSFLGNGIQTSFDVAFPIDSVNSITLAGVVQQVGLKGVDTGKQWYYTQGQTSLVQDTGGLPISGASQTLVVDYNGQVAVTTNVQSPQEVARVAALDSTTGVIDEGEDMSGLTKAAMLLKCVGLTAEFAQENAQLTFSTRRTGLAVGMLLTAFVTSLGVIDLSFLLTSVKITWHASRQSDGSSNPIPTYDIIGVRGPLGATWEHFINGLGALK